MDQGLGDGVLPSDAAEDAHIQSKEGEYVGKLDSRNMLGSQEMVRPAEMSSLESSFNIFGDIFEGKNSPEDLLKHACASQHDLDDAGGMVEELTVRNFNSSNLPMVGASNSRETIQMRQNQWQHDYRLVGGSGSGTSYGNRDNSQVIPGIFQNAGNTSLPECLDQKPLNDEPSVAVEQLISGSNGVSGNMSSHGGIKTKILSKSGFSEFFVKTTLKGKGIICRGQPHDGYRTAPGGQNNVKSSGRPPVAPSANLKAVDGPMVASHASQRFGTKTDMTSSHGVNGPRSVDCNDDGVSLRDWLKSECHKANKAERLHIFRQIVQLVDNSHSQGVVLHELKPSFFKLLQSNRIKYIGIDIQKDHPDILDFSPPDNFLTKRKLPEEGKICSVGGCAKKKKFNESLNLKRWPMFHSRSALQIETRKNSDINMTWTHISQDESNEHHAHVQSSNSSSPYLSHTTQQQSTLVNGQLEDKWYASPEELNDEVCTISSNVYSLGVLLFELLSRFDSEREHAAAMSDLCHRIFPPNFLSENLKEAGFCLQLLHPEPSLRPTTRDVLKSEVISGFQEVLAKDLSSSFDQEDADSELLFHFLVSLKDHMQKHASKLVEDIECLEADIKEIERRHHCENPLVHPLVNTREIRHLGKELLVSELHGTSSPSSKTNEIGLMRNISQLKTAYFSMRSKIQLHETDSTTRQDKDVLRNHNNWSLAQNDEEIHKPTDCLGDFFDGLCKYARYGRFEVRGLLRSGEFNNSANVICSLGFDRDEDYFAAAGVSKKIKIFEFNSFFNDTVDIHYPVIEMSNRSKLSCICWNSYIKSYLASTDYDGMVKLWDVSTGQAVNQYIEHEKRAWSVDFSRVYPTKLASGSDDCSVKLWSINEKGCLGTIRNVANVCCVQFSAHSTHMLAFGSADYKTYCYDLRNTRAPWCVLTGHTKAVSYVKFLDSETIVTASTDNTLKLWDLNKTNSGGPYNACGLTFRGHTNEKNFVGLSVADGYIACGSETNEVYSYYRSLPMPITSHKFGSIDPISGRETEDDNGLFVSSVCWRGKSDMIVAANSSGCIKLLQMV
ncbi:hypothetical protein SLEP1_g47756 [Rubroshorea leprosula]|uniref:Protein kinase domain-containing protein n=1 Tax=Rubroshorea leprosula TaxID=152421 RepID=A0AAV5LRM7_9ROSI|nr:hypothetical protein SLEP1_g47756 [Rubroshorea leprosula]